MSKTIGMSSPCSTPCSTAAAANAPTPSTTPPDALHTANKATA